MEVLKKFEAVSQAVNADIPMNRSSGAAMTLYKCCNSDRPAAKTRVKYQMSVIGSECDEVSNEEIRKEITNRQCYARILFCKNNFSFHTHAEKNAGLWLSTASSL